MAYAGFMPNGKVYVGLCAQRPHGLCWLHAKVSAGLFVPNDLTAYDGLRAQ